MQTFVLIVLVAAVVVLFRRVSVIEQRPHPPAHDSTAAINRRVMVLEAAERRRDQTDAESH